MDAGGLAQMNYNGFPPAGLGVPGSGFASRGRSNNPKRLSVALPPKVNSISENQVDNPTPRTSRSHLLAGLRTAPKSATVPASAPYNQSQHQFQGLGASKYADQSYNPYSHGVPQTATGAGFGYQQYATNAGRQMYALPEQPLAPPNVYDQQDEMDPNYLEQLQLTGMFLAQRQQQLQQQLANITAAASLNNQFQGLSLNTNVTRGQQQQQTPVTPMTPQTGYYTQQQVQSAMMQSPIEVPGQPGVYLVCDPMTGQYNYAFDSAVRPPPQNALSSSHLQTQATPFNNYPSASLPKRDLPHFSSRSEVSPPPHNDRSTPFSMRSTTPPKKTPSPPTTLERVEPLPPPSATAFRRGHNKSTSLAFNNVNTPESDMAGPKTAAFSRFPPTPMTGTFGPGAARAGEHPIRQPRGPPPMEELIALPTTKHEGSKNFATRQRRRAVQDLVRAGMGRRVSSRGPGSVGSGSPVSEGEITFNLSEDEMGSSASSVGAIG
ncbi:hypothetical protein LTR28_012979, partial [Elasticomyces elasticus]